MEIIELVKVYGPLGIGWVVAAFLMKFVLDRYDADIKARVDMSSALRDLVKAIESRAEVFEEIKDVLRRGRT